jgi:hypothetical protein
MTHTTVTKRSKFLSCQTTVKFLELSPPALIFQGLRGFYGSPPKPLLRVRILLPLLVRNPLKPLSFKGFQAFWRMFGFYQIRHVFPENHPKSPTFFDFIFRYTCHTPVKNRAESGLQKQKIVRQEANPAGQLV